MQRILKLNRTFQSLRVRRRKQMMENGKKISKKRKSQKTNKKKPRKSKRAKDVIDEEDTLYGIPELPFDDIPVRYASENEVEELPYDEVPVKSLKMDNPGVPEAVPLVVSLSTEHAALFAHPNHCTGENSPDVKLSCDAKVPSVEDLGMEQTGKASNDGLNEARKARKPEAAQSASSGHPHHHVGKKPQGANPSCPDKICPVVESLDKQAEKTSAQKDLKVEGSPFLEIKMKHRKMSSSLSKKKTLGPVKLFRMDNTGAAESMLPVACISAEQQTSTANCSEKKTQDIRISCHDKVGQEQDLGMGEGRKASYDDLIKALKTEKAKHFKLKKALKAEESRLSKLSSSLSEERHMRIKLSSELEAALSHQQRAVEECGQLAMELQEARTVCAELQVAVETEMAETEKLSNQLQDWNLQLNKKTTELEESKGIEVELRALLQKECERYEKLSLEHQALLFRLQEVPSATKAETNQISHEKENQILTSTAQVPCADKPPCKVENTSLESKDQSPTCKHQNLLAELQSLGSKYEALVSEHGVVLSDFQHLQADHQALQLAHRELKSNLQETQGHIFKMATALTGSQSGRSTVEAEVQTGQSQLQKSSNIEGFTTQLADLHERNREVSSTMAQLRDSVKALTKGLDRQKVDNIKLGKMLQQARDELTMITPALHKQLDQQRADNVALRQELQREKDKAAYLEKKREKKDRMIMEQRKAKRQSVELSQGVTENSLLLIKELRSDNARLQKRLLKEADMYIAYVDKTKGILAKNKEQLETATTKYKAALKDASVSHSEVKELKAKLAAKEMEVKELHHVTTVGKRSLDHFTSNYGVTAKQSNSADVILNTLVIL